MEPPRFEPPFIPPRATAPATKPISVSPATRLQIRGANLLAGDGTPTVKLNDRPLAIAEADDDELLVHIPHDAASGALEVTLPDGTTTAYALAVEDEWSSPEGSV
jgi:hypothetical protein